MPYFTTADGTRLFYQDWGDGRPIVFVSTRAMSSDMWENQVPFLTQHGLRCVSYDRRGTRRSDLPSDGYDFDTLADHLAVLIDHLGLSDATLAGHFHGHRGGDPLPGRPRRRREGDQGRAAVLDHSLRALERG